MDVARAANRLSLNMEIRHEKEPSKVGKMGVKSCVLGEVCFVDPVPCEILDKDRRNPCVPGDENSHGRNVTEDQPAIALQNKMGKLRDLFFIERKEGVKPRRGFCKIHLQRGFLNKTDIGEKRVIGESAGKGMMEKPFRDRGENFEFLFRVKEMKGFHHGCSPCRVAVAVRGDETGDPILIESRHPHFESIMVSQLLGHFP